MQGTQEEKEKVAVRKGTFIVFEGIDGCGKSTQIRVLEERLKAQKVFFSTTKEPSDGPIGKLLRQYLSGSIKADEATLAALFAADRLEHITNDTDGIRKKVDEGACVICDRYMMSNLAYQGATVPLDWIKQLNRKATELILPSCQIFIDVPPEIALERIVDGRSQREIYETIERLNEVYKRFLDLAKNEDVFIVDGVGSQEQVAGEIWETLTKKAGIDFTDFGVMSR